LSSQFTKTSAARAHPAKAGAAKPRVLASLATPTLPADATKVLKIAELPNGWSMMSFDLQRCGIAVAFFTPRQHVAAESPSPFPVQSHVIVTLCRCDAE
jgi:hypothetical protein